MNYFTKELWRQTNSRNNELARIAGIQWEKNSRDYAVYEKSIARYFHDGLLTLLKSNGGFHDFQIKEMKFSVTKKKGILGRITLSGNGKRFRITLTGVTKMCVDVADMSWCICGLLSWGYYELAILDENQISLSVLCDVENELHFECADIFVQEVYGR